MNKPKIFGIATDTIRKGSEIVLVNGKRLYGAVGWYRIINPIKKLGGKCVVGMGIRATAEDAMKLKKKGDIWFMKMADNDGMNNLYGAHKDFTGAKVVLDLDDDPVHTNIDHPDFEELDKKKPNRLEMIRMADHIVASTPNVASVVEEINPHVTVIPNAIDPEIWKVKRKRRKDGKIRIVWISSGSHFSDLPLIKTVMDEILGTYPNVEFHFAGMVWGDAENDRFFHHEGTLGYKDFPQFYADLDPDIAIAPLKDNQFNNCKSNIKWLEASMLAVPTVASDVLPYSDIKHGETGYLATTPSQMTKYIKWLIEDPELRKKIGKAAKKEAETKWHIDNFLPLYEKLFEKLNEKKDITVMTAITKGKDTLKEQPEYKGVNYMAFLDKEVKHPLWDIKPACNKFKNPVMNAKIHKMLGHKYCDTDYIMWIDGSITLTEDPHKLIKLMGDKDFAFFKHPGRECLYDEVTACVKLNKGDIFDLAEQQKTYAGKAFPIKAGLNECTVFIRKNNPEANAVFEAWWAEVCRFSERDQVSFPFVFKDKKWATIPGSVNYIKDNEDFPGNKFFKFKQHKK